jgi:cardiolipin synthase
MSALARPLAIAALASLASACAMLPSLEHAERDATGRSAKSIPIVGPNGELMGEARERIEDKLRALPTATLERKLVLSNAYTGAPLTVGNGTTILLDGPASYREMFAAIERARDHVHLESYIFNDVAIHKRLSDLLLRKAREGVQVRVIYDGVGSRETSKDFLRALEDGGVALCEFNPVNPLKARLLFINHRDHRKILVVDGRVAFTGGINFDSVYMSGSGGKSMPSLDDGWRDTHLKLEGPAVPELQRLFLSTWEKQGCRALDARNPYPPTPARGEMVVSVIGSSPSDDKMSPMYLTLLAALVYAEKSIHLSAAYFVPDPNTILALKAAAARGVDVKVLLPGFTDSWLAFHAGRSFYDELLAGGVRLYEYQGGVFHAKTAVIDGVWSTIGSSNIDWRSFFYNDEVNAVVVGASFGAEMERIFQQDLADATEVTRERWAQRDAYARFAEFTARWFEQQL